MTPAAQRCAERSAYARELRELRDDLRDVLLGAWVRMVVAELALGIDCLRACALVERGMGTWRRLWTEYTCSKAEWTAYRHVVAIAEARR